MPGGNLLFLISNWYWVIRSGTDEWGVQLPGKIFIPLSGLYPGPAESDKIQSNQQTAPALIPDKIIPEL